MILTGFREVNRWRPRWRRDPVFTPGVPYEAPPIRTFSGVMPSDDAEVLARLADETARTDPLTAARTVFAQQEGQ